MTAAQVQFEPGSFKDPLGSVFYFRHDVYRSLTQQAYAQFSALFKSGLIRDYIECGYLIQSDLVPCEDVPGLQKDVSESGYLIKQPRVPFISYPYEWCFSQLKDAAIKTLAFTEKCLSDNLILKDATAFNLALYQGNVQFFDILSIETYEKDQPWIAYQQFCQQFLFPLLLSAYKGIDTQLLMRGHFQALTASHAAKYFSGTDIFKAGILKHVYLLSLMERRYEAKDIKVKEVLKKTHFPKELIVSNLKNLTKTISKLDYFVPKSEWSDYVNECNYRDDDRSKKHAFLEEYLRESAPKTIVDLGCNTGEYSYLASKSAEIVVSVDADALSIERLYNKLNSDSVNNIFPVVGNLLNPTPSLGWAGEERQSLLDRLRSMDSFFALALVHHICISGNVPVSKFIDLLAQIGRSGVVEWVDKKDEQVQKLLRNREDVFGDYTWENFQKLLSQKFKIIKIQDTHAGDRKLCFVGPR
ncbi:hypothetical protein [Thalassospira tepidiphila]|uniref:hypothetical protein n=1 Tax=Thalassospira tepidiphila TaxID=393657 RepID=UPI003AA84255